MDKFCVTYLFKLLAWQQDFSDAEKWETALQKLKSFVENNIVFRGILKNTTGFVTLVFYLRQFKFKVNYFEESHEDMILLFTESGHLE